MPFRGAEDQAQSETCSSSSGSFGESSTEVVALGNFGSLGHPHLCRRACLSFRHGRCAEGKDCEFCHHGVHDTSARLDKRQRGAMSGLSYEQVASLVLKPCYTKAEEANLAKKPDAQEIFKLLEEAAEDADPPSIPSRELRNLCKGLRRLSFPALVNLATRHASSLKAERPEQLGMSLEMLRLEFFPGHADATFFISL